MKLADIRPGWHTDFVLHRFGALLLERPDCLVVRTPANPGFYWGNALLLPQLPADDALAHWLGRFREEIGAPQPQSRHVAIGVDADPGGPAAALARALPSWTAAGFEVLVHTLLALDPGALREPSPGQARAAPAGFTLRVLDLATEGEALIDLEITDAEGFEPEGYRAYLRAQQQRYRAMASAGLLQWFGLFAPGGGARAAPVASCGLLRDAAAPGAAARFQRVVTHPQWRRRGLATALVHGVSRHALQHWRADRVYMVADPEAAAIGIYRRLGYEPRSGAVALQRRAPEDGGPPA
jgi:ribosomal protein S18 acetylase RimI-like enzyme